MGENVNKSIFCEVADKKISVTWKKINNNRYNIHTTVDCEYYNSGSCWNTSCGPCGIRDKVVTLLFNQ